MTPRSSTFDLCSTRAFMRFVSVVAIVAFCSLTVLPTAWSQETAPASDSSEGGSASSAGMGAAAGLSSLLYFPLKAAFAIGGGLVGGLAYVFSGADDKAAKSIWTTSMYGTYFITPDHLRGDKPIRFLGVPDQPDTTTAQPAPEPIR